jgi:transcriptional regulator with XRE-family HTH domain
MNGYEQNTSSLWVRLARLFQDREYRHSYAESFTNTLIAAQLKANREMRKLSQAQLAELAGMKQSRISTIENVNYDSWSVRTLRRIAQAFDLVLVIKFESFGNLVHEMESFDRASLERPSFPDDPAFASQKPAASEPVADAELTVRGDAIGDLNTGDLKPVANLASYRRASSKVQETTPSARPELLEEDLWLNTSGA